ncbi:MAG: di-heme oxidoredictase family protein [Planctomycetota bacterium]
MKIQTRWLLAGGLTCSLFTGGAFAQTATQPTWGDPLPGLTPTETAAFFVGLDAFSLNFTEGDGLGPVFNDNSCASCHSDPVVGGSGTTTVTRFGFADKGDPFDPLDVFGGSLLQDEAISDPCSETVPIEANIIAERVTTLSLGLGLIEQIPDAAIEANEIASATGSIHWVPELENPGAPLRPGRFGWKAQLATVLSFSGDATLMEMGITNPIVGTENAPNGDAALLAACDLVPDPEDDGTFIDQITAFQRFSAGPPQTPKSGMAGEQIFLDLGCASCHVDTTYTTSATAPETALQNVSFKPYTDFLVHDMGSLGDGIVQGGANEFEMRTPPLWGLRYRQALLHDGRSNQAVFSERVADAISQHGGAGFASASQFGMLPPGDVDSLMAFLESLGRREFDSNFDNVISQADYLAFVDCYTGPGVGTVTPDDPCAVHDVDQDGDVDLDDLDSLLAVYIDVQDDCNANGVVDLIDFITGDAQDCNDNLVADSCDISSGSSDDLNSNGIPDECETLVDFVRSDCNTDGAVDLSDVIYLLDVIFGPIDAFDCDVACDSNSDTVLDLADAIYSLSHQFAGGSEPAAPFPNCGTDPGSPLGCASSATCP